MKSKFKFHKINKLDYDAGSDIMPAYPHDFGNYVARYGMGNFQIQVILKLDGRIDFDKLSKAVRLSVDAEPVLGCRFVEDDPPYWKRLEDIGQTEFCSMEETTNVEDAVQRFLESRLDMDHDPMVKVKLIRSQEYDTIGIKLNHTCSDGAGTKEYIHLLANIYSCIDCENGEYVLTPSVRSREDHERILNTLGIENPELDNSVVESPRTVWPFPWKPGGDKNVTPFAICRLPAGQLDILSKFAKERGATINDLILAAMYRAMFKLSRPPYGIPMDIGLTLDLRRYLPDNKAQAIRNLSGGIVLRIPRIHGESFEGTLSRVVSAMNRKKNANPGYQCASGAERAEIFPFHHFLAFSRFISKASEILSQISTFCSPGLSNVGLISKSLIKFGEHEVTDAYIIPPVIRAPGLLIVASSYNGILTLATGYYKGSIDRKFLERLLKKMKSELMEGCKAK
ncbi:MAG TPA: alcohol acetyltransferase [Desulfitobacterium dehalogenans]|uniref:Alcohol acetyltransferase n=1 Tax=Desulfitobacterium dehalogenans TaxID=36854 RepID=A0A7C7D6D0_9FIRM|nr:alcohol acetyltransferase [Desulfitobacterium dehalogenans]